MRSKTEIGKASSLVDLPLIANPDQCPAQASS
jgi:hypothetical protein